MITNNATNNSNASGGTYIAYLFKGIPGFSAFGSYTGNGSADGPFINTGFKPRFLMVKRTDVVSGSNWTIFDSARNTYNPVANMLISDNTNTEATNAGLATYDLLVNGFKVRSSGGNGWANVSGATYIYVAFADVPFKYSASPATLIAQNAADTFLIGMPY